MEAEQLHSLMYNLSVEAVSICKRTGRYEELRSWASIAHDHLRWAHGICDNRTQEMALHASKTHGSKDHIAPVFTDCDAIAFERKLVEILA